MSEPMRDDVAAVLQGPTETIWNALQRNHSQLKAALSANREKDAEIARLKAELDEFREHAHVNKEYGTFPISDERLAEMCQETKRWKRDDDEIYRVVHELKDARASLRASGGEKWIEIKPDTKLNDQMEVGRWISKDKWTITRMEGDAEGWEYTQPNDFFTHYRMLAPPTLTREDE